MDNIKMRVDYWKQIWEDLINNFLKKSYGLKLYSPHILIEDIIIEIEENQFKNSDNKKYFYSQLNHYIENDSVIKSIFSSDFKLLRKSFNEDKNNYVLILCKRINEEFKKGTYFTEILKEIEIEVNCGEQVDIDYINKINLLSQNLIIEFIRKSYSLKDIKKFIKNIFSDYSYYEDNLITNFPHDIEESSYLDIEGVLNTDHYNKDIEFLIDNITLIERISYLYKYYNKQPKKVKYIFCIRGIKGEIDKSFLGVHFYSLNKKKYLSGSKYEYIENLRLSENDDENYVRAAVDVDYLLPDSSLKGAMEKIECSIDILCSYFNIKTEILVDESNYLVIDEDDNFLAHSSGRGRNDEFVAMIDSFEISKFEDQLEDLEKFNFLWNDNSETIRKIKNALHWYRKGENSHKDADKLINYWIAIENLFNTSVDIKKDIFKETNKSKFHVIQEVISSNQIFNFIHKYGWELYFLYSNKVVNIITPSNIPLDILTKAQLNYEPNKREIYLKNFISELQNIIKYEDNIFVIEKSKVVLNFYSNKKFRGVEINKHVDEVKRDMLMIYRFRNLIVHNAYFNNTLLPYYVWKVKIYSGNLIRKFISNYKAELNLSDIILSVIIEKEKYLIDIENSNDDIFK